MESLTPRAASVLLARALGHVDLIQPATIRPAMRDLFAAGIELCTIRRSLIGLPVETTLDIARKLLDAVERMPAQGGAQPSSYPADDRDHFVN